MAISIACTVQKDRHKPRSPSKNFMVAIRQREKDDQSKSAKADLGFARIDDHEVGWSASCNKGKGWSFRSSRTGSRAIVDSGLRGKGLNHHVDVVTIIVQFTL